MLFHCDMLYDVLERSRCYSVTRGGYGGRRHSESMIISFAFKLYVPAMQYCPVVTILCTPTVHCERATYLDKRASVCCGSLDSH